MSKSLIRVLKDLPYIRSIDGTVEGKITGITSDSRAIQPGYVFFALAGNQTDGNRFIIDAVEKGAAAVVSEQPRDVTLASRIPWIESTDINRFLALFSRRFFDLDDLGIKLIGITGTNGKTTTAHLIHRLLKSIGKKSMFVGTTGVDLGTEHSDSDYTTPPAFIIHELAAKARDRGLSYIVMEVSSHALKLGRVFGLEFAAAVFTNLSHEHLDLHGTMEDYFNTKLELFSMVEEDGFIVINHDDPYGQKLLATDHARTTFSFGLQSGFCQVKSRSIDRKKWLQKVVLRVKNGLHELNSQLLGSYDGLNIAAACITINQLGVSWKEIEEQLPSIAPPDGRFNRFQIGTIQCIIDFAHTPDALSRLLDSVAGFQESDQKIITVFGCPGSRDKTKRPKMGRIASDKSDFVILTSDDIHYEDPDTILQDITAGIEHANFKVVVDRREAIREGLKMAGPGHILIIAGRGHERHQYVGEKKIPFYDRDVVKEEAEKIGLSV